MLILADKEILFISEKFNEYSDLFGDYQDNIEFLAISSKALLRPIELINPKLYEATIKLYN